MPEARAHVGLLAFDRLRDDLASAGKGQRGGLVPMHEVAAAIGHHHPLDRTAIASPGPGLHELAAGIIKAIVLHQSADLETHTAGIRRPVADDFPSQTIRAGGGNERLPVLRLWTNAGTTSLDVRKRHVGHENGLVSLRDIRLVHIMQDAEEVVDLRQRMRRTFDEAGVVVPGTCNLDEAEVGLGPGDAVGAFSIAHGPPATLRHSLMLLSIMPRYHMRNFSPSCMTLP